MNLSTLVDSLDYQLIEGTLDKEIEKLTYHSRDVISGSLFFAIEGVRTDGIEYVEEAVKRGAEAVIAQRGGWSKKRVKGQGEVTFIQVENVRLAMAIMAKNFYNNPSKDLLVIGVTGTKGKTTTTFMIRNILEAAGIKTGIIGTVHSGYEGKMEKSSHTTPQSVDLQKLIWEMKEAGCKAVVLEVSSQGLKHQRVEGIEFDIGVFTNISPDHIGQGEHRDYGEYRYWKSRLFNKCRRAVINVDDREWPQMVKDTDLEKIIFYGHSPEADFRIGRMEFLNEEGSLAGRYHMTSTGPCGDGKSHILTVGMPGNFNMENSAAAVAVTRALGVPWSIIAETLEKIKVPGRAEVIPVEGIRIMVDYAHNGRALAVLLESLGEYRPERIILVFGCGGERDKGRRKDMALAAVRFADIIIVTSDNPRGEEPRLIIDEIVSYMKDACNVKIEEDRREAITCALQEYQPGDIIVIAGKGHETYQIIGNDVQHFDDREEVLRAVKRLKKGMEKK